VLAVAGTHGKTTTTSMLAWILERAGLAPGFLVGGVPLDFGVSARLGGETGSPGAAFVIEADEYDTAFFDKRSKFVHYRPRTAVLNNLEFDHADIFDDLAAIERQFHHLVRTVPARGRVVVNATEQSLRRVLAQGCWSEVARFGAGGEWEAHGPHDAFDVLHHGERVARVEWALSGLHNQMNGLAAIAAAEHVGVEASNAAAALGTFQNVRRRMELRGSVERASGAFRVYDDFAHHPTAIATTIDGLRKRIGNARLIAVLEPRSHTMRMGVHQQTLAPSLAGADQVWLYAPPDLGWDLSSVAGSLGERGHVSGEVDALAAELAAAARPGDHLLVMSNGGFGGLHGKLLTALGTQP
jgi:UDP-N-acetylmuramate: L-alanyl-gamma-D-glutamyl-meso-diaminopimelate ligase